MAKYYVKDIKRCTEIIENACAIQPLYILLSIGRYFTLRHCLASRTQGGYDIYIKTSLGGMLSVYRLRFKLYRTDSPYGVVERSPGILLLHKTFKVAVISFCGFVVLLAIIHICISFQIMNFSQIASSLVIMVVAMTAVFVVSKKNLFDMYSWKINIVARRELICMLQDICSIGEEKRSGVYD